MHSLMTPPMVQMHQHHPQDPHQMPVDAIRMMGPHCFKDN